MLSEGGRHDRLDQARGCHGVDHVGVARLRGSDTKTIHANLSPFAAAGLQGGAALGQRRRGAGRVAAHPRRLAAWQRHDGACGTRLVQTVWAPAFRTRADTRKPWRCGRCACVPSQRRTARAGRCRATSCALELLAEGGSRAAPARIRERSGRDAAAAFGVLVLRLALIARAPMMVRSSATLARAGTRNNSLLSAV